MNPIFPRSAETGGGERFRSVSLSLYRKRERHILHDVHFMSFRRHRLCFAATMHVSALLPQTTAVASPKKTTSSSPLSLFRLRKQISLAQHTKIHPNSTTALYWLDNINLLSRLSTSILEISFSAAENISVRPFCRGVRNSGNREKASDITGQCSQRTLSVMDVHARPYTCSPSVTMVSGSNYM